MKLSEAIRIGASWSSQSKGLFKTELGTCALGAAYEGVFGEMPLSNPKGYDFASLEWHKLRSMFPYVSSMVEPPHQMWSTCKVDMSLVVAIYLLNDVYRWTREQIADYVEGLENKYDWTGVDNGIKKETCVEPAKPSYSTDTQSVLVQPAAQRGV